MSECCIPLPSDEYYRYGPPVPILLFTDGSGQLSIPPDPYRSMLAFWSVSAAVTLFPDSAPIEGGVASKIGQGLTPFSAPLIINYDHEGILSTFGWLVTGAAGVAVQLIVAKRVPIPENQPRPAMPNLSRLGYTLRR